MIHYKQSYASVHTHTDLIRKAACQRKTGNVKPKSALLKYLWHGYQEELQEPRVPMVTKPFSMQMNLFCSNTNPVNEKETGEVLCMECCVTRM